MQGLNVKRNVLQGFIFHHFHCTACTKHKTDEDCRPDSTSIVFIHSKWLNIWDDWYSWHYTNWSLLGKKGWYLKNLLFLGAPHKWWFACLLYVYIYISVVMCLWILVIFPFKVICSSQSGIGCELYIHTAPSWQWPLLAPQLSQSY